MVLEYSMKDGATFGKMKLQQRCGWLHRGLCSESRVSGGFCAKTCRYVEVTVAFQGQRRVEVDHVHKLVTTNAVFRAS